MKLLKTTFLLFLLPTSILFAQNTSNIDKQDSASFVEKQIKRQQFKSSLKVPALLAGAGLLAYSDNDIFSNAEIKEERNEKYPQFRIHADDYLQYAPIATVYGLNLLGIKGKNNFRDRTAILLKAELIMMAMVTPTKMLTHELRPDGSAHTSFPSGHTAQAFVAATFMSREYGAISPWYSIGAYSVAASVGVLRVMNNRHYASDVLVGAAVGILSTNLAYLTHQYKRTKKRKPSLVLVPSYNSGNFGFQMSMKL